jgi:hypothetical protein
VSHLPSQQFYVWTEGCDFKDLHGGNSTEWKPPNVTAKRMNTKWINRLLGLMKKGGV